MLDLRSKSVHRCHFHEILRSAPRLSAPVGSAKQVVGFGKLARTRVKTVATPSRSGTSGRLTGTRLIGKDSM